MFMNIEEWNKEIKDNFMNKEFVEKFLNKLKEDLQDLKPGSMEEALCKAQIAEISKLLAILT